MTTTTETPSTILPLAEVTFTGSVNRCAAGERLDDGDGDGWGQCVVDNVEVNTWLAQAAAERSGLPAGTTCQYPATIATGQTSVVSCPTVNLDGSEGLWAFTLDSDSSVRTAASYTETKPAPVTTPPPTVPPQTAPPAPEPPPAPSTDPHFGTCKEAKANGYGPYYSGQDVEYDWYRDADSDGIVCE